MNALALENTSQRTLETIMHPKILFNQRQLQEVTEQVPVQDPRILAPAEELDDGELPLENPPKTILKPGVKNPTTVKRHELVNNVHPTNSACKVILCKGKRNVIKVPFIQCKGNREKEGCCIKCHKLYVKDGYFRYGVVEEGDEYIITDTTFGTPEELIGCSAQSHRDWVKKLKKYM